MAEHRRYMVIEKRTMFIVFIYFYVIKKHYCFQNAVFRLEKIFEKFEYLI